MSITDLQCRTTPASCVTSTGIPAQNAPNILKPLVPNPHSNPFTHGADWVGQFQHSQHSPPPPPLKFFRTPTLSFSPLREKLVIQIS